MTNFYRFPPTQESPYRGTGTNPKYLERYRIFKTAD